MKIINFLKIFYSSVEYRLTIKTPIIYGWDWILFVTGGKIFQKMLNNFNHLELMICF